MFVSSNVSARFSIVSLYLSLKLIISFGHGSLARTRPDFWRISYQVKSDRLEFGDSVVLSPRRNDPRADKAGRPFLTIGVVSLAIR